MAEIVSGATFETKVVKSTVPVVVDFFAEWCGPCRQLAPVFDETSQELGTRYKFVKVNIDDDRDLAIKYSVSSIPTLLFFKDGVVVGKETGFMGKDALVETIEDMFV